MTLRSTVRTPTVAGQFYPKQASELTRQLEFFLSKSERKERKKSKKTLKNTSCTPKILIVPHAGYAYSGQIAADAFSRLLNPASKIKTIFLLGNSHQFYLEKAALSGAKSWETPLGNVPVNHQSTKQLLEKNDWQVNDQAHLYEHSLEVQIPFLQHVLADSSTNFDSPNFSIVPILLSGFEVSFLERIAQDLVDVMDQDDLLVISSDLSHYPTAEIASQADSEIIQAILDRDLARFKSLTVQTSPEENLQTRACAAEAIKVGMMVADLLGLSQTKLYSYQHSGKVSQDQQKVVGYAGIGFY